MHPAHAAPIRRHRGFTLIELMIAVAIVALLAAVAYPSYQNSVRKSRRSDALNALTAVQQAQERWRGNNTAYTATLSDLGSGITSPTAAGHYTLALSSATATGYTATATAAGSQAADSSCAVMAVQLNGGALKYAGGSGSITWSSTNLDPNRCWAK